ncbi:unnamed protein product [Boreogadus saida]
MKPSAGLQSLKALPLKEAEADSLEALLTSHSGPPPGPTLALHRGPLWPSTGAHSGPPPGPTLALHRGPLWPSTGAHSGPPPGPTLALHRGPLWPSTRPR